MKILILSYEFPPLGGGGAKVVHGLSKTLVQMGHEIDLVTMGFRGLRKREKMDGIDVYRVPCFRRNDMMCTVPEMMSYVASAIPYTLKLIKQRRYELIHTHFIYPDGLISVIAKDLLKIPYIITAHGSDVPGYNPNRFLIEHKFLFPLWKWITTSANLIVSPSESLRDLILLSNPVSKIKTIPNGIEVDQFNPVDKKDKKILVVTRLFERKGIQYLLKALQSLNLEYEVNIVGDGPALHVLKALAHELDIAVNFLGWRDNTSPELKRLYETSSIFILPSESENFPIVLLEAMTAGNAVITTSGTGCAEVVGDTGLLVPPKDPKALSEAIMKLVENPGLAKSLQSAARKRIERYFGWTVVAKQYLEMYEKHAKKEKGPLKTSI